MSRLEIIQIVTGTIGSIGFALLFNIRGKKLLPVAIGGGMGWLILLLLSRVIDEATGYFIVSMLITLYAEIMARIMKSPTTLFIIPSLIPLIPGASLYYTMTHMLSGNMDQFFSKALSTLRLAASIAIGVIVATVLMRLIIKLSTLFQERRARQAVCRSPGKDSKGRTEE